MSHRQASSPWSPEDIPEEVLPCCPVLLARIGVEVHQLAYSVGNIWTGSNSKIAECTHSIEIRYLLHLSQVLWCAPNISLVGLRPGFMGVVTGFMGVVTGAQWGQGCRS